MKIAIIEDNAADSRTAATLLKLYFHQQTSDCSYQEPYAIDLFESGEEFILKFTKGSYDLIFIDCFLKEISGLETAKIIRSRDASVAVIFISASRDHAIDCYKVRASDYIIKPLTFDKLSEALSLLDMTCLQKCQYLEVICGREQLRLPLTEIIYCDASGHYVQIHMQDSDIMRSRISFQQLMQQLLPYPQFLSCYRGCAINMDQVAHIRDLDFVMNDGSHVPIRRKECVKLKKLYHNYIFNHTFPPLMR